MLQGSADQRAQSWRGAKLAQLCDVVEPWEYGTICRASRYPKYWSANVVRVERTPTLSAGELAALADEALTGLEHRRIDFDTDLGTVRGEFTALGWQSLRLVFMRHEHAPELAASHHVEEVAYAATQDLRIAWHAEDYPDHPLGEHLNETLEIAQLRQTRAFVVLDADELVGFSTLERIGDQAEIAAAYVMPGYRGQGIGTALTLAAIEAGRGYADLFICADDEDRPKHLYERLGFRSAWTMTEFLRLPS